MTILLTVVWILAMMVYSFMADYARTFPNHHNKTIPLFRWGSLILAMALSFQLASRFKGQLTTNGMWFFMLTAFGVIILSKFIFRAYIKHKNIQ